MSGFSSSLRTVRSLVILTWVRQRNQRFLTYHIFCCVSLTPLYLNEIEHGYDTLQKDKAFLDAEASSSIFVVDVWFLFVLADCEKPSHPDVGASTKSEISDLPHIFALCRSRLCILMKGECYIMNKTVVSSVLFFACLLSKQPD